MPVSPSITLDRVTKRFDAKYALDHVAATMKERHPEAFAEGGAFVGGFVEVDDARYQGIRELNETAKRLAALK